MEKSFLLFLPCVALLVQFHLSSVANATVLNITIDQSTLLALKAHISYDPYNILANWSTNTSVYRWFGVTCGSRYRRITALNLSHMGLVGIFPPHLGNLSFLISLSIKNNSFYGSLPCELARLYRLQFLSYGFNNFDGEIPSWLGQLSKLQNLHLFHNKFVGTIPQSLSNMSSLQEIDLAYNQLSGSILSPILNISLLRVIALNSNKLSSGLPIDVFHHLPNLQCPDLSYNQFDGKLPSSLFKCKELQYLSLRNNNFIGRIPLGIGNLTLLSVLYLNFNKFEGDLPSTMFKCKQLQTLSLSYNKFIGKVPLEIGNLSMVTHVYLDNNSFEGAIPSTIGNLENLKKLDIGCNHFIGLIPFEMFNMSSIQVIGMQFNKLLGHLPSNIGIFLPNLQVLLLEENELSRTIPSSISNASQLIHLDLSKNSFSGFIPIALGNLRHLQRLGLFGNNLTIESITLDSNFFSLFSNMANLRYLALSNNPLNIILPTYIGNLSNSLNELFMLNCNIKGNIPKDIGNLSNLMTLVLPSNELIGSIPSTVGRLHNLQALYIENNRLEGLIPSNLCHLKKLYTLSLFSNELFGQIPACLSNLTSLRYLDLSSNRLTSMIPLSLWSLTYILGVNLSSNSLSGLLPFKITNLKVLIGLDLSRNQLSRDIPPGIGELVSLELLDLSNNNLSRQIPKSLEALLYLKYLNISFNRLRGEIPTGGPFVRFSATSFSSNDGLCGASQLQVHLCIDVSQLKKTTTTFILKYIVRTIGTIILVAIVVLSWTRYKRRNAEFQVEIELSPLSTWRRISYQELAQATNGFNMKNFLGEGSFGVVYEGILLDGKHVAIKVFNLEVERAFKSFTVECEILSKIHHQNLLKIISICSNINFKAFILEYMPNGSLETWLYSQDYYLSILQRLNIMIDVASALEYLHYESLVPIVHCDLKPSNVLLDEDMVAHVVDFGIAKLLGDGNSIMQTMTLATIGYMAPGRIISTRSDVYSYGILLMETFTRKKPTDFMFTEEMSLKHWVEKSSIVSITKVIDSNLLKVEKDHDSMDSMKDCMSSIIELALLCCEELPNQRISAKIISTTLNRIKSKFLQVY